MHTTINYKNPPGCTAVTFQHLAEGCWYQGVQSGRLYYFYRSCEGKPRLLRLDDAADCTTRFQRGGTFIAVPVSISVDNVVPGYRPLEA